MKIAFLLILAVGAVAARGREKNEESHQDAEASRPKRWSGFNLFGKSTKRPPTGTNSRPSGGDGGLNLDALHEDLQTAKPSAGIDTGFNLEDALHPAVRPTDGPGGGDCQAGVVQKLSRVIENQNQQLRLLAQLLARSSSSPRA